MQNSRFLRSVIVMQKSFNETLSALYQKLYMNEFNIGENNEHNFDISSISVSLPSPASLNMTNLADQVSTVSGVVDFIVQTITGQNADPDDADSIRRVITAKYIPGINWNEIDELINKNAIDKVSDELLKKKSDSDQDQY